MLCVHAGQVNVPSQKVLTVVHLVAQCLVMSTGSELVHEFVQNGQFYIRTSCEWQSGNKYNFCGIDTCQWYVNIKCNWNDDRSKTLVLCCCYTTIGSNSSKSGWARYAKLCFEASTIERQRNPSDSNKHKGWPATIVCVRYVADLEARCYSCIL